MRGIAYNPDEVQLLPSLATLVAIHSSLMSSVIGILCAHCNLVRAIHDGPAGPKRSGHYLDLGDCVHLLCPDGWRTL